MLTMVARGIACLVLCLLHLSVSFLLQGKSDKKGIGLEWHNHRCGDFAALKGIHWWYDWRVDTKRYSDMCSEPVLPGYVPMVWSWNVDGHNNNHDFGHYDTVLGFNEPNHIGQGNLTYRQAVKAWKEVERQAGSRTLVSPAAAPCGGHNCYGNVIPWFTGFFNECKGCRVDYLATHWYGCQPDQLMSFLQDLWNRFHLKIWLTEFSCEQAAPSHHLNYMKQVLPRLEAAPFVYRYAWFSTRRYDKAYVSGNLLHLNSSQLTELGRFYMQF